MTHDEADIIIEELWQEIKKIRSSKGGAYAFESDTLYNVKESGHRNRLPVFRVIRNYTTKHEICIDNAIDRNPEYPDERTEGIKGRILDIIVYWLLFYCAWVEKTKQLNESKQ
jgi:hypothetical protein